MTYAVSIDVKSFVREHLVPHATLGWDRHDILNCKIERWTAGKIANATFFGDPIYSKTYFERENSSREFGDRWRVALGDWDDKIVVDIGCGPGNLLAAVGGAPRMAIGIDISHGALKYARQVGYTPILADAHKLPLVDGCADIVTLNASLHHCDCMATVLAEAARLVRPGGLLITDEDPIAEAGTHTGLAALIIAARERFPLYWWPGRASLARSPEELALRSATEIHNSRPGDGIALELFSETLIPLGFTLDLYPHYHNVGAELFEGQLGRLGTKDRLIQLCAPPGAPKPPRSVMCIARRSRRFDGRLRARALDRN